MGYVLGQRPGRVVIFPFFGTIPTWEFTVERGRDPQAVGRPQLSAPKGALRRKKELGFSEVSST